MKAVLASRAESASPARWFIWVIYGALIESAALGKVTRSPPSSPPLSSALALKWPWKVGKPRKVAALAAYATYLRLPFPLLPSLSL